MRERNQPKQQLSVCTPDESGLEGHVRRLKGGSVWIGAAALPPIARIARKPQLDDLEANRRAFTAIKTSVRASQVTMGERLVLALEMLRFVGR